MTPADEEDHFEWDDGRADRFRGRADAVKTAILLCPFDAAAVTVLQTTFGRQEMRGAFYLVAEEDGSYGAARAEFEAAHESVGEHRWVKSAPVDAYRIDTPVVVRTLIGAAQESSVQATPGDWVVRQETGEVMVVTDTEFQRRYEPSD